MHSVRLGNRLREWNFDAWICLPSGKNIDIESTLFSISGSFKFTRREHFLWNSSSLETNSQWWKWWKRGTQERGENNHMYYFTNQDQLKWRNSSPQKNIKKTQSVITYSPSCHSKTVFTVTSMEQYFFCNCNIILFFTFYVLFYDVSLANNHHHLISIAPSSSVNILIDHHLHQSPLSSLSCSSNSIVIMTITPSSSFITISITVTVRIIVSHRHYHHYHQNHHPPSSPTLLSLP